MVHIAHIARADLQFAQERNLRRRRRADRKPSADQRTGAAQILEIVDHPLNPNLHRGKVAHVELKPELLDARIFEAVAIALHQKPVPQRHVVERAHLHENVLAGTPITNVVNFSQDALHRIVGVVKIPPLLVEIPLIVHENLNVQRHAELADGDVRPETDPLPLFAVYGHAAHGGRVRGLGFRLRGFLLFGIEGRCEQQQQAERQHDTFSHDVLLSWKLVIGDWCG